MQPKSFSDQREGKALAELYRGSGCWPLQPHPVDLEPPFDSWLEKSLTEWDCYLNGWQYGFKTGLFGRRVKTRRVFNPDHSLELPEASWANDSETLRPVTIEQFADDEATIDQADQFLRSLTHLYRPASFEIIGLGEQPQFDTTKGEEILRDRTNGDKSRNMSDAIIGWSTPFTTMQFVVHRGDATVLRNQLLSHYPNSAIVVQDSLWPDHDPIASGHLDDGYGISLQLANPFVFPLRTLTNLHTDPLNVVIGAFDHLPRGDWGWLQILFCPVHNPWQEVVLAAATDPYNAGHLVFNDIEPAQLRDKFDSPLFAVSIRLAAKRKPVFEQLLGWSNQFTNPPQQLTPIDTDSFDDRVNALVDRSTYRPGIVLNSRELASLIHLCAPTITSDRLKTVPTRTRQAPMVSRAVGSVTLGTNLHRGQKTTACIPPGLRARHAYVAGASGTGKSTLLANMVKEDITAGAGVGVLDPHGDLITDVLSLIPTRRVKDVVLFDPVDVEFPPALNILHARDAAERDRLVSEVIDTLEKFSSSPWGARFAHIFKHAVATMLRIKGTTLWDVRRILIDDSYRTTCVAKLTDPTLHSFWQNEWPKLPKGAVDPILNRLGPFLMAENVRNILCQREVLLDFDTIINSGKILLCNLSTGLLTKPVSGVFGTFIMSKIINAAFRRAAIPRDKRRPFRLFIDEFQNFMGDQLSVGFEDILAEARKYALTLTVANQYVDQLTPAVRQAIFGNVGTLLTFRLGVKDAKLVSQEFGDFTAEELMSLEVGQAIARVGGSRTAYNVVTKVPPEPHEPDLTAAIRNRCRRYYARPKAIVEQQLMTPERKTATTKEATPAATVAPIPNTSSSPDLPSATNDDDLDLLNDFVQ